MVQGGEASPARAWTAAEPLVSRYNEKGRVVGELEVPPVAVGFGFGERVYVPAASITHCFFQVDHGECVLFVRVRCEVDLTGFFSVVQLQERAPSNLA